MLRLIDIKSGETATVVLVRAVSEENRKIINLGLLPGEKVKVLNNSGLGPIIIIVKGSKLALGYNLAINIFVKEV